MENIKMPYDESDFKTLRNEGYMYVDKTMYIEKLEDYTYATYLRPRKFGKSLFVNMLMCYYDINTKYEFEKLFKGLYIYDNPTEKKNNYYILSFNFSGMDISDTKEIKKGFNERVYTSCKEFIAKYDLDIKLEEKTSASMILLDLLSKFQNLKRNLKLGNKIYVIIDEYDYLINGIFDGDISCYIKSLEQGGFVRAFYEIIKEYAGCADSVIDRFFATGVTPIALDSLTSGFNIATNISSYPQFVSMCGVTKEEVKELVKQTGLNSKVYEELMKKYDGYRFSQSTDLHTLNTTLVMYYLKSYVEFNKAPIDLVDNNLATLGNKIESFANLVNPNKNYEKLVELITDGEVCEDIVRQFELNENVFYRDSFLSLLYYHGYITIKDVSVFPILCIPNYVSETLYASYFQKMIATSKKYNIETQDINNGIIQFGDNGSIEEMTKAIVSFLSSQSIRYKENFSEENLKNIYSLFFSLSSKYYVYGEFSTSQEFADIFVEKSVVSNFKYEAIIELKYLSKEKAKEINNQKLRLDGIEQMERYIKDKRFEKRENLKKFVIIFEGFETYHIYEV